jgi:two-component system response regulator FlrC
MRKKKIMLVKNDTDDSKCQMYQTFSRYGHHVKTAVNGFSALNEIIEDQYDLIISDLNLPRMSGLELLKRIKEVKEFLPVILISANPAVSDAVEAMKIGASDFLLKPMTFKMLEIINSQLLNGLSKTNKVKPKERFTIITKNQEMNRILELARQIADSQASVFIQGESGTGKELFARYIHHRSSRSNQPFVAINCAAMPENLLESELFGHEKGAFTGALNRKKGKFEMADCGTLLLDEISEMDYQLQSKLLRVLQEREIDRIGGTEPISVDVRIIATTNRDIEQQVEDGKFREDLYYRLNVIPIKLPPLRERKDDIPLLANYFVDKYNQLDRKDVKGLTEEAMTSLIQRPWKGNVREFENIIERSVLMCRGDYIDTSSFLLSGRNIENENYEYSHTPLFSLKEMEKNVIIRALDQTNGNRTHAAEILGISVRTLRNKLNEYRKLMEAKQ